MKKTDTTADTAEEEDSFQDSEEDANVSAVDISLITGKDADELPGDMCRICRRRCKVNTLRRMCACTGAMVHKQCLETRLASLCLDRCELCHFKYNLKWDSRYSIPRGMWLWITRHASRIQLLLVALLAVLVVCEGVAFYEFVEYSVQTIGAGPPSKQEDEEEEEEDSQSMAEYWQYFVGEMELPGWFLSLSVLLLCRHALLLVSLVAEAVASFRHWRCTSSSVTILDT